MASVSVTITLAANSKANCDVEVSRDSDGEKSWERFGWSIGGLDLLATKGTWTYYYPEKALYLLSADDKVVGSATKLRSDFLVAVTCGKTLECDGEVWHTHQYRAAKWNFWYGCA
jgi:hypothetical protein